MAKQLNSYQVNLQFTADSKQAQQQLQDLQNQLNNLMANSIKTDASLGISKDIQGAIQLTAQLKTQLQQATDVNTGKLDLSKFNQTLKQGGVSLKEYQKSLSLLGPEGEKAFANLATSITQAELPLRRTNSLLKEFGTTLANTARWQISSSILHGFMGSLQTAYGYAQDLNESLNNIRIVTGQTTDQMAKFAKQANIAAKALSTTTTEYTDAALIYYQQGLNDEQVKERTDITIKMANVARESAEIVSDQMTAVWNNFYNGSQSLEHYADAMVRLGADTSSSSDEIAGGLEKFAAVADTIGLSFDNAAAALATITATTRQSEDVVGTALKTIFARIQGLKLGETLEDGTTLNQYSQALEKVGINIKDSNGELKDMDNIIEEMGNKWQSIDKDQQVALAQQVAGVRQYTQLIALMDHFDYYKENLARAQGADGSLQEQADIYAESWEAAGDRVKASAQKIYAALLDDNFFIDLTNGFSSVLDIIGNVSQSLGGMPGMLLLIGSTMSKVFSKELTTSFDNWFYNLGLKFGTIKNDIEELKKQANESLILSGNKNTTSGKAMNMAYSEQSTAQLMLIENADKLSEKEKQIASSLLDQHNLLVQSVIKRGEEVELAEKEVNTLNKRSSVMAKVMASRTYQDGTLQGKEDAENVAKRFEKAKQQVQAYSELVYKLSSVPIVSEEQFKTEGLEKVRKILDEVYIKGKDLNKQDLGFGADNKNIKALIESLDKGTLTAKKFEIALAGLDDTNSIKRLTKTLELCGYETKDAMKLAMQLVDTYNKVGDSAANLTEDEQRLANATKSLGDWFATAKGETQTLGSAFSASINGLSNFGMALMSIKGLIDTLNDSDMSFGDKLISTFAQLGFILPNLGYSINTIKTLFGPSGIIGSFIASKTALESLNASYGKSTIAVISHKIAQNADKIATDDSTRATMTKYVAEKLNCEVDEAATIIKTILIQKKQQETLAVEKNTLAEIKNRAIKLLTNKTFLATVAISAVVIGTLYAVSKAANAEAESLQRATEAAENLKEKSQQTKTELNNIISAFDQYQTAIDTLNECTKGTDEWKEALSDVNEQIWDILEAYPELSKIDNLFNEDGTFNQEAIDSFIADKRDKSNNAQAAALASQAAVSQMEYQSNRKEAVNQVYSVVSKYSTNGESNAENKKIAGELVDAIVNAINSPDGIQNIDGIFEDYAKQFDNISIGTSLDDFTNALKGCSDNLKELGRNAKETGNQVDNTGKLLSKQVLGDNTTDEQANDFTNIFDSAYAKQKRITLNGLKTDFTKWAGRNNSIVKDYWQQYKDATGYDYNLTSNAVQGSGDNRVFEYYNDDGNKVTISVEEMAEAIASAQAKNDAEKSTREDLNNTLGEDISSNISSDVDISLLNDLVQTMNLEDETTRQALEAMFDVNQTASEQEDIIKDLVNTLSEEEKAQQEVASLTENAVQKYGLDADDIEDQAKRIQKAYDLTEVEATKLAIANQRMNNGVKNLSDNWENWNSVLKKSQIDDKEKLTKEYTDTIQDLTKTIADLTGASEDLELPDEFFDSADNLELINQAAQGSTDAINQLGIAVAKTTVDLMEINDAEKNLTMTYGDNEDEGILPEYIRNFQDNKEIILNGLDEISAKLAEGQDLTGKGLEEILSGGTEAANNWVNALNEMVMATNMSVEDMNSTLSQMGLTADVDVTEETITSKKPVTKTTLTYGELDKVTGFQKEITQQSSIIGYTPVPEKIQVAQIATNGAKNTPPKVNFTGSGPISHSSTSSGKKSSGGSSSSKPSKIDKSKKSDVVDRYKEITDSINDTTRALDKANKSADRLWGKAHLNAMAKSNKLTLKEVDLLKQKQKEAQAYLKTDKATLQQAAKKAGITFTFDEDGDISNYTDQMTKLYNQLVAAQDKANSFSTKDAQDAYKEATLDPIQKKIDELKDAISQYEDTRDLVEELTDDIQDKINEWQDRNYQMLTYEVEVKVQLDENDTKKLEYYFDKLSDNIYKAAEALGYLQGQFDPVISQLGTYENFYGQLNNAYSNGEISQENYIEGLQDVYDNTLDNLNALQDLDKEMLEYYGNTIDLANDELSKYTDHMEHLTSVLDHYRSIITLLGKDKDYDKVLSVLNGTAQTKKNNFDTSKQWYESLKRERDAAAAALASSTDEAEREVLQKNYDAILAAFNEAEEDMLSKAEEYGEALKEILTTKMEQAADEMNKQLSTTKVSINGNNFNISGWDALNDALDRMSSYQDEYLTKTNQIYEMNKLLNNVNQAIDKTNNQAAKNRYQQFTKEIEQLRDKDKLSQLELEIAQAKYKVLEAQIALEEAQNAKSTVRLQRDNEGNFGYVYTADQEKVNDAQQALADAENDLYNIRLNATNKYGQQKLQYEKELADKLAELDQKAAEDAVYRETTYQQERALVIQQYTDLITTAGNLYAKAQEEDSRVVQDAWVNSFDIIKDNSNSWKDTITENTNIINDTFKEWQDSMDEISKIVGDDLKDTQQKVKDVTDESNKLYQEVSNRVIPALESELSSVRSATEAWAQHRQQLLDTIRAYEELLTAIQATLRAQSGFSGGSGNNSGNSDWSKDMGSVSYGSEEYYKYMQNREDKINGGYDVGAATNARVDAFYRKGLTLPVTRNGQTYHYFTDIPDSVWKQLVGFRSGGYTGTWNDGGKLAFLHQKELVLNADDTENMLASIQLVRQIAKQLDFNSQQISTLSSSGFTVSSQDGTLEQNVRIEASFPNATDRYEIQEAFNTLVNVASQYANRK